MTTFKKHHPVRFTMAPHAIMDRDDMNFLAKGILVYYLGKPDDWRPRTDHLQRMAPDEGRQKLTGAVNELIRLGYYRRTRTQGADGTWTTLVEVTSVPFDFGDTEPVPDDPTDEQPTAENPTLGGSAVITKTRDHRKREVPRSSRRAGENGEHPPPARIHGSEAAVARHLQRAAQGDPGPDSSLGLASEFGRRAEERDLVGPGDLQDTALARNISGWLKKGDTPDGVRQLMDEFLASRGARTGNTPLWQRFTRDAYGLRHSRRAKRPVDYSAGLEVTTESRFG